ncbi:hydroxyacid dehydrogenase [Variovorax sp. PBL-E5]|uniref:hydroxyacid dehydrogenase n=1 Tax=Variovorax sp. PBL-E5 TaxID=434014 RepID=UPI0013174C7D|nr:hydroxyacid dehydrogenase [Variovorax sp. PBL-E5]VTU39631.1 (S)-sulfolactate dehydrogenase [Variovorax sp. PBL-E5]
MTRIVIAEFMDEAAVAQLRAQHDVLYDPTLVDDGARLHREAADADALIVRNRTQVRGELLAALARCRVVGRLGVGLDNIDVAGCEARGMRVIPATGANALSVAEYVIASAMLLLRGAYASTAAVAAGQWPRHALSNGRELSGKTLGLIGFGSIGQLTAGMARALGMRVIAFDAMMDGAHPTFAESGARCVGLDALVAEADVVSLHVPLVDSTRQLFDAARIAAMKPGAVLINSSRGGIVDEAALAEALRAGRLGGAALDVFDAEPLAASPHFADCPHLLLTPHIAGVTVESNERVSSLVARKVLEALHA